MRKSPSRSDAMKIAVGFIPRLMHAGALPRGATRDNVTSPHRLKTRPFSTSVKIRRRSATHHRTCQTHGINPTATFIALAQRFSSEVFVILSHPDPTKIGRVHPGPN